MRTLNKVLPLLVLIACFYDSYGQQTGTLLLITNKKTRVIFDGEEKGLTEPNIPFKVTASEGEHYAQVQYEENGSMLDKAETVVVEVGKQKIIKLLFEDVVAPTPLYPVAVSELNFSIPGSINVGIWIHNNPNTPYSYPSHYFAFEKGDEIVLNASMTNKNGTNVIEVATHPNGVVKYINKSFTELRDLRIKVEERSIYRFTFATNHAFDRNCILKISRKPESAASVNFNTNVSKQKIYKPVSLGEPAIQWVNSGSNAFFSGGKSRILLPVSLPPNTIAWYYRFSASRNKEDMENVRKNFQLFGDLTKLFMASTGVGLMGTKVVDIGVEQLSNPPGANICDVFMLDYDNISNFEAKNDSDWKYILQGTRKNLMSGNVKIDCCNQGQYYLGIRNPDPTNGINVSIEITAITVSDEWIIEENN